MPDAPDPPSDLPPYWVLISVLFSSFPLSSSLAMTLHQVAYELHKSGAGVQKVHGDLVSGQVTNLKKDVALAGISGPMFEAELETERGSGSVRFLLTRQGLQLMHDHEERVQRQPARPKYLN